MRVVRGAAEQSPLVERRPLRDRNAEQGRLIALVDANLDAFVRHFASAPAEAIPASIRWAAGTADRGYSTWTRAHADAALEAALPLAGFRLATDLPALVLEERPEARPVPPGIRIERVVDAAGVQAFHAVDRAAGSPDAVPAIGAESAAMLHPDVAAFVAYADDEPVAGALSYTAPPVTRIAWVGTVPTYRRRGLGDAATRAAILAGFDRGATIAALESSAIGLELYRSMGFRQITTYRIWRIG